MTQIIYTSRTPIQAYQRCKRLRWLSTHEGEEKIGLEPRRKSLHLVVGSAVHAGMEVLLREGQAALDIVDGIDLAEKLHCLFDYKVGDGGPTTARAIEDRAVAAALKAFDEDFGVGVELDPEEAAAMAARPNDPNLSVGMASGDSPIVIDFTDFGPIQK